MRYHISKNGKVYPCRAKGDCPLGTAMTGNTGREATQKLKEYLLQKPKEIGTFEMKVSLKEKYNLVEASERGLFVNSAVGIALKNGMTTEDLYRDPVTGKYTEERQAFHRKLLDKLHEKYEDIPCEGKVLFSAGLPGAGKTTVLGLINESEGIPTSEYATVSSDDFKELFAEEGLVPEVEGLLPMEATTLTHKETSYLSDKFLEELGDKKKNIIYDFTCREFDVTEKRMNVLLSRGYEAKDMQFVFVDIPLEVAQERAIIRYNIGLNSAVEAEGNHIGGRYLPPDVLLSNASKTGKFTSKNAEALLEVHDFFKSQGLPEPIVYDNSGNVFKDPTYKPTRIDFEDFANRRNQ